MRQEVGVELSRQQVRRVQLSWHKLHAMKVSPLQFLLVAGLNTLIAAFLLAIGVGQDFIRNLIVSQCIGLSIYASWIVVARSLKGDSARRLGKIVAIPAGTAVGVALAWLAVGRSGSNLDLPMAGQSLLIGLFFGVGISAFFVLRERMFSLQSQLHAQQLREMEIDKQRIEAQLKMLQAQIEPHFLFNTLANVSGLIDSDAPKAKALLIHLIHYLRATLRRIRAENPSLGDEVNLLKAYLDVLQIRMVGRLSYSFDIPATIGVKPFPSMLLQPLVENAVKHGLEPKLGNGKVEIVAGEEGACWYIEVRDNGVGLSVAPGSGVGLANVRERLRALYASAAVLTIAENPGGGVVSRIEIAGG